MLVLTSVQSICFNYILFTRVFTDWVTGQFPKKKSALEKCTDNEQLSSKTCSYQHATWTQWKHLVMLTWVCSHQQIITAASKDLKCTIKCIRGVCFARLLAAVITNVCECVLYRVQIIPVWFCLLNVECWSSPGGVEVSHLLRLQITSVNGWKWVVVGCYLWLNTVLDIFYFKNMLKQ